MIAPKGLLRRVLWVREAPRLILLWSFWPYCSVREASLTILFPALPDWEYRFEIWEPQYVPLDLRNELDLQNIVSFYNELNALWAHNVNQWLREPYLSPGRTLVSYSTLKMYFVNRISTATTGWLVDQKLSHKCSFDQRIAYTNNSDFLIFWPKFDFSRNRWPACTR